MAVSKKMVSAPAEKAAAEEKKAAVVQAESKEAEPAGKGGKTRTAKTETGAVKKASAKKPAAKKAEVKSVVHVQFDGKSYSQEELMKIAKDVWKYDLKQKVRELKSVELYVKPEESTVYYVMNQDFTGSFRI